MNEDFNTAEAVSILFDLASQINKCKSSDAAMASVLAATLKHLGGVLGLLQDDPASYLKRGGNAGNLNDDEIDALIDQRALAKANQNWQEADRIRDQLKSQGIELEDNGGATSWRRG